MTLLRHGESQWNRADRFAGWADVSLTGDGIAEARNAGRLLRKAGFLYDVCFTSVLERSVETARIALEEMGQSGVRVESHWRLNERHYGDLEGARRSEIRGRYGNGKTFAWRWSWDARPPALERNDPRFPGNDSRYADMAESELPVAESLADCSRRVLQDWHEAIAPHVCRGDRVLIVAHSSSLRALVKHIDSIRDDEIPSVHIPTGRPIIYELGDDLKPLRHYIVEGRQPSRVGRWLRRQWARKIRRA